MRLYGCTLPSHVWLNFKSAAEEKIPPLLYGRSEQEGKGQTDYKIAGMMRSKERVFGCMR